MKRANTRLIAESAVIAALYAALTLVSSTLGIAFGPIQFRFSEALTILPVLTPAAIPGLAIGCFISNLSSPYGIIDIIFGTAATSVAAVVSYKLRHITIKKIPLLSVLSPVVFNALLIGLELSLFSDLGFSFDNFSWAIFISIGLSVGAGELIMCAGLGVPLLFALRRTLTFKT